MNWVRAIAGIIVLWSGTVWGATLTWTANSEPDLAGYHVYQCSLQPCTLSSGHASLLVTLGTVASFNIGTPSTTQYYFVKAYDFANNASGESNLATFTPAGVPPPPPPPAVSLKVVGDPATGPWGVEGSTTDLRDVMATVHLDGVVHHTESNTPYGFPDDNGTTATTGLFGTGSHTVEFVFYLQGTTSEIGRASVTVQEGSPPPPPPVEPPAIGVSPTNLSFTATQGSANPATQTLSISNTGDGTLSWTAADNTSWLTISPASGTGNGAVMLTVTTGALAAGSYNATVTLNATGAHAVTVPVTFTVATASMPPAIGVSPTSLSFTARRGSSDPATQTLSISNTGSGTLNWTAVDNAPWLTLLTLLGQASGTGNAVVPVSVSIGNLAVGTYTGSITVSATGGTSVTVPVTLNIKRQRNR
jgi:Viral BACON domain